MLEKIKQYILTIRINLTKNDLVNYLIRSIQVDDNNPNQIMCNLQVYVKEDCELPIGLHPMLRIPKNKSKIKIKNEMAKRRRTLQHVNLNRKMQILLQLL